MSSVVIPKKDFVEIRIHGRGGQGAWTASKILTEAALVANKYAQGFPEFGPERSGAPVRSFVRIGNKEIHMHSGVYEADVVIILDPTLLELSLVDYNVNAIFVFPSLESGNEAKEKLSGKNVSIWAVNAIKIAVDEFGRSITNTVMLGAFVKATREEIISLEALLEGAKRVLEERLSPEMVEKNLKAIRRAYQECQKLK